MSLRMIELFKRIQGHPSQRLVAYMLADSYNDTTKRCDPSYARLRELTSLSNRTLSTAIAALEAAGHITVQRLHGSRHHFVLHPCPVEPLEDPQKELPLAQEEATPPQIQPVPAQQTVKQHPPQPQAAKQHPQPNQTSFHLQIQPPPPAKEISPKEIPPTHPPPPPATPQPSSLSDDAAPAKRPRAERGSLEELRAYAMELSLPPSDGEAMFDHWTANGWRNGSNPCVDWRAGLRTWRHRGWLPSQRQPTARASPNGSPWRARQAYDPQRATAGKTLQQIKQF